MRIVSLTKKKLGDTFSLVTIKHKTFFGKVKERDAYVKTDETGYRTWYWCDNAKIVFHEELLNQFYDSTAFDYEVNSKRQTSF